MEGGAAAAATAAIDKAKKPLHRNPNNPDHSKQHRSIFEVPPDFFDSCRLLHPSLSTLPDFENSPDDAVEESKSEKEVAENNYSSGDFDSIGAKVMQRWSCNTCKAEFESLQEQRFHFKSDLHRFNIKLSVAGKGIIKEEEFDAMISDSLSKDYDVSSISGSDDEDERETSVLNRKRGFGGISKSKIYIQLRNGEIVTVWKCLLLSESENISFETNNSLVMDRAGVVYLTQREVVEKLKYILHEPRDNSRLRIVLLARGGHFAGCVFDGDLLVVHKTFHRYVVRAKAGKKQSSKDAGKQGIHSAGASLRRYNELALKKDIQELLTLWKPHFAVASCIFIYAPSDNRELFFDGDKPYFICQHRAIRNIPLTIRRPTLREARRIYSLLVQVSSELREEIAPSTKEESLSGADIQTDSHPESCKTELREDFEGQKVVVAGSLVKEMDGLSVSTDSREDTDVIRMSTPLHEAAKSGNAEKVLDLLEQGLDPCIKDERGQTPYMVACDKEVRNTFRRFMASNLEKWDWHTAKVPSALTKEMEEAQAGVSVPVLRFLLCFIATVPVSFFHSLLPGGPAVRHLYAAATGALLSYLSFGFSSNLLFVVPVLVGYASMALCRRYCGIITFFLAFGYLIGCHVYYMSGEAWKEGGIDATGALMVLTLKVISCVINYNDGLRKEEGLREAQKKFRLLKLPSLLEYFGYCLCCGSHFACPVYEMKDYLEWTERKGIWQPTKGSLPSPYWATFRTLLQASMCMGLYLYLVPHFPLSRFTEPVYQEYGFWKRLGYQYMAGFTARCKYYFIWSVSEASVIISGYGFSGWTHSNPPKPRWDRAKNVDILGYELAKSAVEIPLVWNIQVSTWLRHYVYERLIQKGKKPGFFQLLATQTVSAVWHGLYPGYIIFFLQSAIVIAGSKVIYRWQQASQSALVKKLLMSFNFAYTLVAFSYSCIGFMVLSMHETLTAYGSVYYIGTIVPVALILLGQVIKPARPARSKARKDE